MIGNEMAVQATRSENVDRTSRTIWLSLAAVLSLAGFALVLSLFVPYNIQQAGAAARITGVVELYRPGNSAPVTLDPNQERYPLDLGERLAIEPGGSAVVQVFSRGRIELTGPASFTLVESHRRATTLGHLFDQDRFSRRYSLQLAQSAGTARYDFTQVSPPFNQINVVIELPNRLYRPDNPCFTITIDAEQQVMIQPGVCTP